MASEACPGPVLHRIILRRVHAGRRISRPGVQRGRRGAPHVLRQDRHDQQQDRYHDGRHGGPAPGRDRARRPFRCIRPIGHTGPVRRTGTGTGAGLTGPDHPGRVRLRHPGGRAGAFPAGPLGERPGDPLGFPAVHRARRVPPRRPGRRPSAGPESPGRRRAVARSGVGRPLAWSVNPAAARRRPAGCSPGWTSRPVAVSCSTARTSRI